MGKGFWENYHNFYLWGENALPSAGVKISWLYFLVQVPSTQSDSGAGVEAGAGAGAGEGAHFLFQVSPENLVPPELRKYMKEESKPEKVKKEK